MKMKMRVRASVDVPTSQPLVYINNDLGQFGAPLEKQDIYDATFYRTGFFESDRGLYNLGFANSTPGRYTLALVLNADLGSPPNKYSGPSYTSRLIWEANREDPVGFNASLTLGADGNLVLRDADGRFVWSTDTANKGATHAEILKTGNFVVRSNNTILWQSFDHPSDTLMVSQIFEPGMKLQSRTTLSNSSLGVYSLVMEPGGLVLYSNFSGSQEPYWVKSYYGQDTLSGALRTCDSLVAAVLEGDGPRLFLDLKTNGSAAANLKSQTLCSLNATEPLQLKNSNTWQNQSLIRLEPDGNLRAYTLGSMYLWEDPYQLFDDVDSCWLPQKCQPFGICSNGACVGCLNPDRTEAAWSNTCTAPRVDNCTDVQSLDFLPVPGAEYFSSRYLNSSVTSFEDCRSGCLQNCSCSAFFYWNESSSCFMTNNVNTLQTVSNQSHVAYIKATKVEQGSGTPQPGVTGLSAGAIAGTVVGGLFLMLVCILAVIFFIKKRRQIQAVEYDSDTFLESIENLRPIRFTLSDLERITDNFSKVLGTGGFGGVYEGVLPDGRKVAVKKLESTGQGKKEFYAEVAVLGTIHHWNLVKLLGFCSEGLNRLLVYEHMENGSLDKWIYQDFLEERVLNWEQRMEIMLGMARGLAYLHEECVEKIIHLDIKPQNILLNEDLVAKVADFGLSRLMSRDQSYVMTTMRGTPGYLAPEWLLEAAITEKSDVYSFGVVLLEVISGRRNFSRLSEGEKFYLPAYALELVTQEKEMELVDTRLKGKCDEAIVRAVIRIAFQCLQENGNSRPSMGKVVQMLEGSSPVEDIPLDGLPFSTRNEARILHVDFLGTGSTSASYCPQSGSSLSAR
ncbi:G-type lectin S-receptor-like serine/threonine-protein kinase SD2-5 [Selaginella moellendorffii]|nr:G-type lectin S-receptor-like serine/threonine-protein kinase SD2-5 [Selaginella moellendorffii]|eukprot:XP_024515630.1 G-type lectin S-receptor-like serine/threonine-protein kinase SD2-5 [Selaginella moellendorffii]